MRHLTRKLQRLAIFLVEEVRLITYVILFGVVVASFAFFYMVLTPFGHGLGSNSGPLSHVSIWQGLYFSVVTISSLGYGDLHPLGISRLLACIEVLFGLSVIGIVIAKITSRKLSHHVSRLFSSDAQKRLEEIALKFSECQTTIAGIAPVIANAYQDIPGTPPTDHGRNIIEEFRTALNQLKSSCESLSSYINYECDQCDFFEVAPSGAIVRVGEEIDHAFCNLGQLIIGMTPRSRTELLDRQNRQNIADSIESQKRACRMVRQKATHVETINIFARISDTCERVPNSSFVIPEHCHPIVGQRKSWPMEFKSSTRRV